MMEPQPNATERQNTYPGFWHAALLCFIFIASQTLLLIPVVFFQISLLTNPFFIGTLNLLACEVVLLAAWLIGGFKTVRALTVRAIAPGTLAGVVLACLGAIILISEIENCVRVVLPPSKFLESIFRALSDTEKDGFGPYFLLAVVAPLTEEVIFRGLILQGFLRRFRAPTAFLLSAMLFGATHMNPWQFISGTLLGILFAAWYARTGSLTPSLLGHALVNSLFIAAKSLPFQIQGFNTSHSSEGTEFQPFWFDLLGMALLAIGCWMFQKTTTGNIQWQPPLDASTPLASEHLEVPTAPK